MPHRDDVLLQSHLHCKSGMSDTSVSAKYGAAVVIVINVIIINELLSLLFLEEHEGLNLTSTSRTHMEFASYFTDINRSCFGLTLSSH